MQIVIPHLDISLLMIQTFPILYNHQVINEELEGGQQK